MCLPTRTPRDWGRATPATFRAAPDPLPRELNLQSEVVAIVVADTENQADDALQQIKVDYEILPFVSTLKEVMAPGAPDLRGGKGNLIRPANAPREFPNATWAAQAGDVDKRFAEADIVKDSSITLRAPSQFLCNRAAAWPSGTATS